MAEVNSRAAANVHQTPIEARLYAGIRADYSARGVFPELCPSVAFGFNGTTTHYVARPTAEAMLLDAEQQHARKYNSATRGTKKSYSALIEMLQAALHPEEHARKLAKAAEERRQASEEALRAEEERRQAAAEVDARCRVEREARRASSAPGEFTDLVRSLTDRADDLSHSREGSTALPLGSIAYCAEGEVKIVEPCRWREVIDEGESVSRPCYIVELDSDQYWVRAGALMDRNGAPLHLKLVSAARAEA